MDNLNLTFLDELYHKAYEILPKIILGILFVIISWLITTLVLFIVRKSLKLSRINHLAKKANDILSLNPSIKIEPEKVILFFVKWFLILLFIVIGSDLLQMNIIYKGVGGLIDYLPKLFSGLVVFTIGLCVTGLLFQKKFPDWSENHD